MEFIENCFTGPVFPASVMMVLILVYGLMVALGGLNLDLFDIDIDFDADVNIDGGVTSIGFVALKFLNIGNVPIMIWASALGLSSYTFPLLGKEDQPARYTVRLHFADLNESAAVGTRVFDVKLQGETVIKDLDVAREAGGAKQALVRVVENVQVTDNLLLELVPRANNPKTEQLSILSAVEVVRTDGK